MAIRFPYKKSYILLPFLHILCQHILIRRAVFYTNSNSTFACQSHSFFRVIFNLNQSYPRQFQIQTIFFVIKFLQIFPSSELGAWTNEITVFSSFLQGGWWWKSCGRGLNGLYLHDPQDLTARQGIVWFRWRGWDYTLKRATMMIKPRGLQPMTPVTST
jgi:Fibrinogen beta and gamma chains, C-terminal globular domain